MIYELRNYTAQPGRLRDLLARFENHTNRIWARYGIRQAGFWTTIVGPTEGLSYLLAWESFAEREEKWNAFRADPELLKAFAESEKNGPLVFKQYGRAERIWCMDRRVPTEAVLGQMRTSDPPVRYLVGTPKGRLN